MKVKENKKKKSSGAALQNVDNLHVQVNGSEAILRGQVTESSMKDAAEQVAKDLGFTKVANKIEVVSAPARAKRK